MVKRKQAAEASPKGAYRTLIDDAPVGVVRGRVIFEGDEPTDLLCLDANDEFERLIGVGDIVGKRLTESTPEILESDPRLLETYGRVARGGTSERLDSYRGGRGWLDVSVACPVPGEILVFLTDITERKRAEEALAESEERYRTLAASTVEAVVIHEGGKIIEVNGVFEQMFGIPASEAIGRSALEFVAPGSHAVVLEHVGSDSPDRYEVVGLHPDGTSFPAEIRSRSTRYRSRSVRITATRDLTEQRDAQKALRESERRLREAQEAAHVGSWELIPGEDKRTWSEEACRLYGLERPPASTEAYLEQIQPNDRGTIKDWIAAAARGEHPGEWNIRIRRPDGEERILRGRGGPVLDDEGHVARIVGTVQDVTDLHEAESARQRLFSQLASAQEDERHRIALDVHDDALQTVAVVGLRLHALRRNLEASPEVNPDETRLFDELESRIEDATGSLRRLVAELSPLSLEMHGLCAALREFLERGLGKDQRFTLDDQTRTELPLRARQLLYRMALEAITNAVKHAGTANIQVLLEEKHQGVRILVLDDGVGLSSEKLDEISSAGHLGLASLRERAEGAGGSIVIAGAPGQGTRVDMWLPLTRLIAL